LTEEEMKELPQELRWEPSLALAGGKRGEEVLFKLIDEAPVILKLGGILLCEIGSGQESLIKEKLAQSSFSSFEVLKDFSGLPRVLKACV
jgi:release factor glutamine methyltransferase